MAFINKETYEILTSCMIGDNGISDIDLYFEVDDMIAPAISVFNKKGYFTKFCCQGHPFLFLDDDIITGIPKDVLMEMYPDIVYSMELGKDTYYMFRKYKNIRRSYIKFGYGVKLPKLPESWRIYNTNCNYDSLTIERIYDTDSSDSSFFVKLAQSMEDLYKFALSLPDIGYKADPELQSIIDSVLSNIPDLTEVEKEMVITAYKEGNSTIDEILHDILDYRGEEIGEE